MGPTIPDVTSRAEAAKRLLEEAREEEFKKRVGVCGVSGWGENEKPVFQPIGGGWERSTETFCPSEGAKTK